MPVLVRVDLPPGPRFVDALRAVWDGGDAAFPLDRRLPPAAAAAVLAAARVGELVEEDDALVVTTSGSTGRPKGVVLTHAALAASANAVHARLGVDPDRDRWLACLPLSHMGGLGVVTRALLTDTPLVVHDGFDAAAAVAVAREAPTRTALVPTAYRRVDTSLFRTVVLGGAAVPDERPANVVATYGLTETAGGVVYDGVALEGMAVRLAEDGEILVRGPTLLRCYRDGSDPRRPDGWLPTGDAGHFDNRGCLVVDGRRDDMIVTGGENVWPAVVEAVLATHPAVAEVAVGSRPDPEWGQRIVAWVVPEAGVDVPTLDDVRDHVKARLPAYCAPRELIAVERLSRTGSGKLRPPTH